MNDKDQDNTVYISMQIRWRGEAHKATVGCKPEEVPNAMKEMCKSWMKKSGAHQAFKISVFMPKKIVLAG